MTSSLQQRVKKVSAILPSRELLGFLSKALDIWRDIEDIRKERAEIECKTMLTAQRIELHYGALREATLLVFAERKEALNSQFEVLRHGMSTNNSELILAAMASIGDIVRTDPFVSLKEFQAALEAGQKFEF